MTDTAIIFVSGLASDARVRLAGLGLLERALLTAARAGVRRCYLIGAAPPPRADARYPTEITALPTTADAAIDALRHAGIGPDDVVLCLHAATVCLPQALTRVATASMNPGGPVLAHATTNTDRQSRALPLAALPLRLLNTVWGVLLTADASQLRSHGDSASVSVSTSDGSFAGQVHSVSEIPSLERDLLLGLENPRDGRIDRWFNRKLSRPLTRIFLRFPLHPNHITILSFLVAVLGAIGFAQGTYVPSLLGALLLQCAAVLDCCDGEVARVKFLESRLGDALDITLDSIANAAIFVGIARGALATNQIAAAYALGAAVALGIMGSFVVVTYIERRLPEPALTPDHRLAQQLVSAMTSRDFSVIVLFASVTAILPWFLWGSAVGANVFWLLLLVLVVRGRATRVVGEQGEAK